MDEFALRALVAGFGLALAMGLLGVFVVWRRMAFFGDTLAHSALLGVALGFALGIAPYAAVAAICVALALALLWLRRSRALAEDTLLGVLAHGSLSLGVVAVALVGAVRVDLLAYLFGDILAVSWTEIAWIWGGVAVVLVALAVLWKPFLALTVHEELARVEGVEAARTQAAFMILVALVIALAMKLVGMLLVTALLILPAASARRYARTPEQMALGAVIFGWLAVALGIALSFVYDLPTGPAIVVAAAALFVLNSIPIRRGSTA